MIRHLAYVEVGLVSIAEHTDGSLEVLVNGSWASSIKASDLEDLEIAAREMTRELDLR